MNKRPKRKIFPKKLEFNEGLHWQEERDLNRALYASLNPNREESSDQQENEDSEGTIDLGVDPSSWEESVESPAGPECVGEAAEVKTESSACVELEKPHTEVNNHAPVDRILRPTNIGRCHNEKKLIRRLYERKRLKEEKMMRKAEKKNKKKTKHEKQDQPPETSPPLKLDCLADNDLKNKKIHAQRKFAVSYSPSASPYKPGPLATPTHKTKRRKSRSERDSILSFSPKTEDFLTFLCLRGTTALPTNLELFRKSHQKSLKLQRKEEARAAEKAAQRAEAASYGQKAASILHQQHRNKSLLQKEKAKAVRTLNHMKQGTARPWRECKSLIKINKRDRTKKPRDLTDIPTGPLAPPCLSPIPPPIMSITEHNNPPPLTPIMPLDSSNKEHKPQNADSQSVLLKPKKHQRNATAQRSTSPSHRAKPTNAAKEAHTVLMKRKLRSSGVVEAGDFKKKRGRKAKVKILKREMTNLLLEGQNNGRLLPSMLKVKKLKKVARLNGNMKTHGPVTRANQIGKVKAGLVLNGTKRNMKKRKTGRLKGSSKDKLKLVDTAENKPKKETEEVTPRRSTRKRIPRFDVQCVYSGLLSNSNAIIQSADCVCACCNTEEQKPRKRRKSAADDRKTSPRSLRKHNKSVEGVGDGEKHLAPLGAKTTEQLNYQVKIKLEIPPQTAPDLPQGREEHCEPVRPVVDTPPAENSMDGTLRVTLNGSYFSKLTSSTQPREDTNPSKDLKLSTDAKPLLKSRNLNKPRKVKNGRIFKNGKAFVKKLRNGSNFTLDSYGAATPKYTPIEDANEIINVAVSGNQPTQEKNRVNKLVAPRRVLPNPLRKKMEKQFGSNRPSSPFSHKPKIMTPPATPVGSKPSCGIIPITLPPMAPNSVIRDIESPSSYSTNSGSSMEEIPTLHPSPLQWADFMGYLEANARTIEKYGMCKVKPPEGYEPRGSFPDSIKLTPEIQYVHRLHHRWSSASKRLACLKRHLEKKENIAFQPPQICGCEVDLLKFSELLSLEGGFKAIRAKKKWPKLADQLNIPRNVSARTYKLESICLKYLVSFTNLSQGEKDELMREVEVERQHRLDASRSNPFSVTQSEVKRVGHQTSLCQFEQRADLLEQIIRAGEDNTPSDIEDEYWKITEESDTHVAAQRAAINGSSGSRYESNLCDLGDSRSNILSVLPAATRQRLPTLKVGTVYSAEPWRKNSHGLCRIEYLHSGNHKIWYSIPASQSAQLERALKEHAAEAKGHLPCLQDKSFIFMLPPEMLQKWGLTVYRGVQHRQELIVQWYDAAASSVSCGFHIAESFPVASSEWLRGAVQAFELSKAFSQPSLFSLGQLLYLLIEDIWQGRNPSRDLIIKVLPLFKTFRNKEILLRNKLQNAGLNLMALADKTSSSPSRGSRSPGRSGPRVPDEELVQCATCNQHCYFSLVTNEREDRVYCLEHAAEMFNNGKTYSGWTVYYRLGQEKMSEVMKLLSQAVPTTGHTDISGDMMTTFYPTVGTTAVA